MSVPQKSARFTRMSHARTAVAVAAIGAGLVIGSTACSSGQVSQSTNQQSAVNGASGTTGSLAIRDVTLVYPSATSKEQFVNSNPVDLSFIISNNSPDTADKLVSIEPKDAGGSVSISGNTAIAANRALVAGASSLSPSATVNPLDPSEKVITAVYTGGDANLTAGLSVPLTFTFENAAPITLPVPLAAPMKKWSAPSNS